MLDTGVDVIYSAAGQSGAGSIEAVSRQEGHLGDRRRLRPVPAARPGQVQGLDPDLGGQERRRRRLRPDQVVKDGKPLTGTRSYASPRTASAWPPPAASSTTSRPSSTRPRRRSSTARSRSRHPVTRLAGLAPGRTTVRRPPRRSPGRIAISVRPASRSRVRRRDHARRRVTRVDALPRDTLHSDRPRPPPSRRSFPAEESAPSTRPARVAAACRRTPRHHQAVPRRRRQPRHRHHRPHAAPCTPSSARTAPASPP